MALAEKKERPVSRVALDLGINENMLRRWIQQAREGLTFHSDQGVQYCVSQSIKLSCHREALQVCRRKRVIRDTDDRGKKTQDAPRASCEKTGRRNALFFYKAQGRKKTSRAGTPKGCGLLELHCQTDACDRYRVASELQIRADIVGKEIPCTQIEPE
ncbi:MAG: transposase [Spirochaetaceae bacterium]|nr:transposase [Spirochaetaceae bacterium]